MNSFASGTSSMAPGWVAAHSRNEWTPGGIPDRPSALVADDLAGRRSRAAQELGAERRQIEAPGIGDAGALAAGCPSSGGSPAAGRSLRGGSFRREGVDADTARHRLQ